jgi:shikimate kinase
VVHGARSPHATIALIGARGSGKTSVGRCLAQRLGWSFLDADAVLEERAGRSIKAIFDAEGEAGFRDRESAVLADLSPLSRHVLALGGGVIVRPENRTLLQRSAWVVWLTADVHTLSARLQHDASTSERRPSLTGTASAGSPDEIAAVLRVREPHYRACADAIVITANRMLDAIAEEIAELWQASLTRSF